nr:MAG TPA: hypothetical protein [Bacteriophage sp.]
MCFLLKMDLHYHLHHQFLKLDNKSLLRLI